MKKILGLLLVGLVAMGAGCFSSVNVNSNASTGRNNGQTVGNAMDEEANEGDDQEADEMANGNAAEKADLIRVTSPVAGAKVTSPLTVTGEARGNWSFEAQFPVKVEDEDGNVLGSSPAHLNGDWMTTDFVSFTATVSFVAPAGTSGWLVLEKDNPSGLPENDDSLRIPITF